MEKQTSLVNSIRVEIGYEHFVRLQMIDLHDFSLVKKKVAQELDINDEEYLNTGIVYLKRYYSLQILDPLNPPAMSKPIGPFWHVHSLYTHQYISFSNQIFGEYLHHVPLLFEDKIAVEFVKDLYNRTVKRHIQVFGESDDKFLPKEAFVAICCTPTKISNPTIISQALFPEETKFKISPYSFLNKPSKKE